MTQLLEKVKNKITKLHLRKKGGGSPIKGCVK